MADQGELAPRDTVLGLGTIDAAFDARGKTVAEVTDYLAERSGLPVDDPRLTDRAIWRTAGHLRLTSLSAGA